MYTPPFNRADDEDELREFVAAVRVGWLVTSRAGAAPAASFLPIIWRADTVIAHFAKANSHWREIEGDTPALLIVTGPDTYVSPSWYAAKAEHGKVVPTRLMRGDCVDASQPLTDDADRIAHPVAPSGSTGAPTTQAELNAGSAGTHRNDGDPVAGLHDGRLRRMAREDRHGCHEMCVQGVHPRPRTEPSQLTSTIPSSA